MILDDWKKTRRHFFQYVCSLSEIVHTAPHMGSSATVAHLLQSLMCYAFRDHFLLPKIVKSGCLNCHRLSISSLFSPWISLINKTFPHAKLQLTGCFLFFAPFHVNSRWSWWWFIFYISMSAHISGCNTSLFL